MSLREFIEVVERKGLLIRVKKPVEVKYEIATIMKMLDGKPLLFQNVKGFSMPVVANICSTRELVALGLGIEKNKILSRLIKAIDHPQEPKIVEAKGYEEIDTDLSSLPILTYYTFDGGPYIASGIVVAKDKELSLNASYHRIMILEKDKVVLRVRPRHFDEFLKRGNLEFAICVGNSIPVLISAAASVELGKSELSIANALKETNLVEFEGHLVPESELIMIAQMTGETHDEGPFLDITETPDIVRSERVARIKKVFSRKNPLFHALLPGGLEHKILMSMPRESAIFREVSKECSLKDVLITPGGCSWLHGAISISRKNHDDGKKAIEAAFKAHKSMKHVYVVDDDINIYDPYEIEWAMATRFQGDRDIVVKREKGSSLDPSSNLETGETTKIGFDLTIPWGRDPKAFKKPELPLKLWIENYLG